MFLKALSTRADGWRWGIVKLTHVEKSWTVPSLLGTASQSFAVHLLWPQFLAAALLSVHLRPTAAAAAATAAPAAAPSSWQPSWDTHQAEVWPLLTERSFVFKKAFAAQLLHFTLALDTVSLIRHEVLNWLVFGKMWTQDKGLQKNCCAGTVANSCVLS